MTQYEMRIHQLEWNADAPAALHGGVATLGNFDGVHRGHAALLMEARRLVEEAGAPVVAVTFEPHPLQLLRPAQFQPVLTSASRKAQLLLQRGADHVVLLHTTPELLQLRARAFFEQVLLQRLGVRALVEGSDFCFGHKREGNVQLLSELCGEQGLTLRIVPPVLHEGTPISSSRVRQALLRGAVDEAALLLEHPYRLGGIVGTGAQRGRTIGFPTANLEQPDSVVPANGVYAVRAWLGEQSWPGAANIGPNPTFGEQARKLEVHLIGFTGDLVGQELEIDFLQRLRDTRPFPNVQQLIEQLRQDVEQAQQIAENQPCQQPT